MRWRAAVTARPRRGLRPQITYLNRRVTESLNLTSITGVGPTDGWNHHSDFAAGVYNAISRAFAFKLSDVNNYAELAALWTAYRITCVDMVVTMSTQLGESAGSNATHQAASNLICRTRPNRYGITIAGVSQMQWNEIQNQKIQYLNGARPTHVRMYLNQSGMVYQSAVNTDYTSQKPNFISTSEVDTPHYGSAVRIEMIDGLQTLGSNGISLRFDFNFHIELRQIK